MIKTAFVPLSVSHQLFSSVRLRQGLAHIPLRYDKFVFVIADRLQFYNAIADGEGLSSSIQEWNVEETKYFRERRAWVYRLASESLATQTALEIYSMDDLADAKWSRIHRNIHAAYVASNKFRSIVDQEAKRFVRSKKLMADPKTQEQLSRLYLLEELTLNVLVRTKFNAYDEFYLGTQSSLLPSVFYSDLNFLVTETPFGEHYNPLDARFFSWSDTAHPKWVEWGRGKIEKTG